MTSKNFSNNFEPVNSEFRSYYTKYIGLVDKTPNVVGIANNTALDTLAHKKVGIAKAILSGASASSLTEAYTTLEYCLSLKWWLEFSY